MQNEYFTQNEQQESMRTRILPESQNVSAMEASVVPLDLATMNICAEVDNEAIIESTMALGFGSCYSSYTSFIRNEDFNPLQNRKGV